ncbi:uncharacterized protein SPPG_01585 [Spizellomyces punctatus DAOM BR117]|uniref:Uncharacterized protein n=1 Tax=Spizellomyces punctatus (strain DAOM BR117) TaxID=645134 RepID=A0A0L0HTC6_SPIPD|nr:uncharacterized protein SPPG_01585 [Spizellomyces punctatus DAOM BR117]KND04150.1 hypothetical protein SPPG_01585 [Spizellomyces punctatus DAOM BR117]|eukprot:XP_016612189.1 hypothetical protein SPPG_01585 [Spizellomyces punctatus DAOM BR117]
MPVQPVRHDEIILPMPGPVTSAANSQGSSTQEVCGSNHNLNSQSSNQSIPENGEADDIVLELGNPRTTWSRRREEEKSHTRRGERSTAEQKNSLPAVGTLWRRWTNRVWEPIRRYLSWEIFQRCTKAVIAFYVASLFVLIDPIAIAFGSGVYLTPFATLFFPPVKTIGAILETVLVGAVGVMFGAAVSLAALASATAYNSSRPEQEKEPVGGFLIQLLFLIVGVFCLGYVRATYPRLNNATLTSIMVMVFPLTTNIYSREVVAASVWNIVKPFMAGAGICLVVDITVFPEFSGRVLRSSIQRTVEETRDLLDLLVKAFLLTDTENPIPMDEILAKQANVRSAILRTKAARRECRYEVTYDRYSPDDYKVIVQPLQEMMKYLSGMVACMKIEKALVEMEDEAAGKEKRSKVMEKLKQRMEQDLEEQARRHRSVRAEHDLLNQRYNEARNNLSVTSINNLTVSSIRSLRSLKAASVDLQDEIAEGHQVQVIGREITGGMFGGSKKLFKKYLASVRSSLHILSRACSDCMDQSAAYMLRVNEETKHDTIVGRTTDTVKRSSMMLATRLGSFAGGLGGLESLESSTGEIPMVEQHSLPSDTSITRLKKSITTFEEIQWSVMERVSHQIDPLSSPSMSSLTDADITIQHWNAANLFREEYFLAFFFIFNMREAMAKVVRFAEAVDALRTKREVKQKFWMPKMKLRTWLKGDGIVWKDYEDGQARDIPLYTEGKETFIAPGWVGRFRWNLWNALQRSANHAVKFGVKMAIATTALAWPAYVWPDWWTWFRGSWALVTMIIVLSPTVGGSNAFGLYRIIGTIFGALWGYVTWIISPRNPYSISVMTIIFAYPCWYIYITTPHSRLGTTALLTYNVVVMTAYFTYYDPEHGDSVSLLAWKRMATITIGVLTALIVTSYVWPFVARIELRKGVSKSVYLMGILYSRLAVFIADEAGVYMHDHDKQQPADSPTAPTAHTATPSHYLLSKHQKERLYVRSLERKLTKSIAYHLELLELTPNEPRLKGPFPYDVYKEMLWCVQNLVDRMGNVRRIVDGEYESAFVDGGVGQDGFGEFVRREIIWPVEKYRMDMFAAILLFFHVIAGSLLAKTPLPAFVPAARAARLRLFSKIRTLPALRDPSLTARKEEKSHWINFMAYACATEDLIEELEKLAGLVKRVFGQGRLGEGLGNVVVAG